MDYAHFMAMAVEEARAGALGDCVFYRTCEPGPICAGAILNGGENLATMVGWDLPVIDGVLGPECIALSTTAAVELTR